MGIATGFTAARMLEIENTTVVDGHVDSNGHLILVTREGTAIDAGDVVGMLPELTTTPSDDIEFVLTGDYETGYSLTATVKASSELLGGANLVVRRNADGTFEVPPPIADAEPTTKKYVDDKVTADIAENGLAKSLGTTDLDTIITPGIYYQSLAANATAARHYPYVAAGGSLMVWNNNPATDVGFVTQMFHARLTSAVSAGQNSLWLRFKQTSGAWSSWKEYRHSEDSRNPYATATGTVIISLSASAVGSAAVTFPAGKFTQSPIIQLTQASLPANSGQLIPKYTLASASGFTAYAYNGTATAVTVSAAFTWTATQMTPTSGAG